MSDVNRKETTTYQDVGVECAQPDCEGSVRVKIPAGGGDITVTCVKCGQNEQYPQFASGTTLQGRKDK